MAALLHLCWFPSICESRARPTDSGVACAVRSSKGMAMPLLVFSAG